MVHTHPGLPRKEAATGRMRLPSADITTRCSARQILRRQQCGLVKHRMQEDLHTICTRPVSLLHMRELRCCAKGQGSQGESVASMAWPGCEAGAFLLKGKSPRTLPVTLSSVRGVTSAGVKTASRLEQGPHEMIRRGTDDNANKVAV